MNNRIDGEAGDMDELMHVGCKMTQKIKSHYFRIASCLDDGNHVEPTLDKL